MRFLAINIFISFWEKIPFLDFLLWLNINYMELTVTGNCACHHSDVLIFIVFAHCLDLFNTFNIVTIILGNVSILEFHQDFHFTIITISIFFSNESRIIASIYSKLSGRCSLINSLLIVLRNARLDHISRSLL